HAHGVLRCRKTPAPAPRRWKGSADPTALAGGEKWRLKSDKFTDVPSRRSNRQSGTCVPNRAVMADSSTRFALGRAGGIGRSRLRDSVILGLRLNSERRRTSEVQVWWKFADLEPAANVAGSAVHHNHGE